MILLALKQIIISLIVLCSATVYAGDLSFMHALQKMRDNNKALSAAQNEVLQQKFKRRAAWGLYLPKVGLQARYTGIDDKIVIDLEEIRSAILFIHQDNLLLENLLPSFEKTVQDERFWNLNATLTWPIFTGGRIIAANRAAQARLNGAQEKLAQVEAELVSELVTRYFGLRLAQEVVDVHQKVLSGMVKHLSDARAMEETGMIAKAERLHAEVYYAEAEREYKKAIRNMEIAQTALNNTISDSGSVEPTSPLFVFRQIEQLSEFRQNAINYNPLLQQIASKRELAHQGYRKELGDYFPEIFLFGKKELYTDDLTLLEPKWAVGIGLNFSIFEGFSRHHRLKAARSTERRVADLEIEAQQDVGTLVKKRYYELINALEQYESTAASLQFAEEYVRVRVRAFEEGMATSIEVVDARLALSRVKIDRLIAMYDFDVALAKLLEASGQSEQFEIYHNRSDLEIENGN